MGSHNYKNNWLVFYVCITVEATQDFSSSEEEVIYVVSTWKTVLCI